MTNQNEPMLSETFGKAVGNLFRGGPANVSWERALEGLSAEDAARQPEHLPHSVAEIVAHVQFWQAFLIRAVQGEPVTWPKHAAEGWPEHTDWETLKAGFLRDVEVLRGYARDPQRAQQPDERGNPLAVNLANFAGHGLYHLGQVVLVRQALGLWPPPSGGDTW